MPANLEAMILGKQGSCKHLLSIASHDRPQRREKPRRIFTCEKNRIRFLIGPREKYFAINTSTKSNDGTSQSLER